MSNGDIGFSDEKTNASGAVLVATDVLVFRIGDRFLHRSEGAENVAVRHKGCIKR